METIFFLVVLELFFLTIANSYNHILRCRYYVSNNCDKKNLHSNYKDMPKYKKKKALLTIKVAFKSAKLVILLGDIINFDTTSTMIFLDNVATVYMVNGIT